jgi:hypothetical protein
MKMRRALAATTLLLIVTAATTGCGAFKKDDELSSALEYHLEATGGSAEKITYSIPQYKADNLDLEDPGPALPWKKAGITYPGTMTVTVTPKDGAASCRIVVEKKELAKKQGQAGAPVTCTAKIKK